jgi:hypothetical protein
MIHDFAPHLHLRRMIHAAFQPLREAAGLPETPAHTAKIIVFPRSLRWVQPRPIRQAQGWSATSFFMPARCDGDVLEAGTLPAGRAIRPG